MTTPRLRRASPRVLDAAGVGLGEAAVIRDQIVHGDKVIIVLGLKETIVHVDQIELVLYSRQCRTVIIQLFFHEFFEGELCLMSEGNQNDSFLNFIGWQVFNVLEDVFEQFLDLSFGLAATLVQLHS